MDLQRVIGEGGTVITNSSIFRPKAGFNKIYDEDPEHPSHGLKIYQRLPVENHAHESNAEEDEAYIFVCKHIAKEWNKSVDEVSAIFSKETFVYWGNLFFGEINMKTFRKRFSE